MSGHNKWSSIKHKKGAADAKRGKIFSRVAKEITLAARDGGGDADSNARLRSAINEGRANNMPLDNIERAIKKGAGETDDAASFEMVVYEGFAPHKVPVVVECLTDNRNRTAPEIRNLFKAGTLGQPGSMSFFFDRWGVVEATHPDRTRDPEADAIEAGAQNVEPLEAEEVPEGSRGERFLTDPKDLAAVSAWLLKAGWKILASEMRHVARNPVELGAVHRQEVAAFLNALDDHDDVHRVYAGLK